MTQSQDYIIALQSLLWLLAEQAPWICCLAGLIQKQGFYGLDFFITIKTDLFFFKSPSQAVV